MLMRHLPRIQGRMDGLFVQLQGVGVVIQMTNDLPTMTLVQNEEGALSGHLLISVDAFSFKHASYNFKKYPLKHSVPAY